LSYLPHLDFHFISLNFTLFYNVDIFLPFLFSSALRPHSHEFIWTVRGVGGVRGVKDMVRFGFGLGVQHLYSRLCCNPHQDNGTLQCIQFVQLLPEDKVRIR
jgi:hypothetical protein